jgi:hypothetical protein
LVVDTLCLVFEMGRSASKRNLKCTRKRTVIGISSVIVFVFR